MMHRALTTIALCTLCAMTLALPVVAGEANDQVYIRKLTGDPALKASRVGGAGDVMCRSIEDALTAKRALCYDVVERLLMLTATQANLGALGRSTAMPVQARMDRTQYVIWGHVRPGKYGMILEVFVSSPVISDGDPLGNPDDKVTFRRKGIKNYGELEKYATKLGKRAAAYTRGQKTKPAPPPPSVR